MKFRKHFAYDVEQASNEACIPVDKQGESLTVQSQTEDTDINVIMKRYGVTGKFPENPRPPEYGDFTGITDFRSAVEAVELARSQFMEFPAELRARFENDPQRVMEFLENPANFDEAAKFGLIKADSIERRRASLQAAQEARRAELVEAARAAGLVVKEEAVKPPAPGST